MNIWKSLMVILPSMPKYEKIFSHINSIFNSLCRWNCTK